MIRCQSLLRQRCGKPDQAGQRRPKDLQDDGELSGKAADQLTLCVHQPVVETSSVDVLQERHRRSVPRDGDAHAERRHNFKPVQQLTLSTLVNLLVITNLSGSTATPRCSVPVSLRMNTSGSPLPHVQSKHERISCCSTHRQRCFAKLQRSERSTLSMIVACNCCLSAVCGGCSCQTRVRSCPRRCCLPRSWDRPTGSMQRQHSAGTDTLQTHTCVSHSCLLSESVVPASLPVLLQHSFPVQLCWWPGMATRCQFENSNDVGVFAKLTNAYCLVAQGGSENFYRYCAMRRLASVCADKRAAPGR